MISTNLNKPPDIKGGQKKLDARWQLIIRSDIALPSDGAIWEIDVSNLSSHNKSKN